MEITTKSAKETASLGQKFSDNLKDGGVVALVGNLGAGKTTFIQGLAKGLGITDRILSPTFIILREYPLNNNFFYHVDMYRLEGNLKQEIINLGLPDFWKNKASKNVVVIEWAEKIKEHLPDNTIWITFKQVNNNKRNISIIK